MLADDRELIISHPLCGDIATIRRVEPEGSEMRFSVTAPDRRTGNLAARWLSHEMEAYGLYSDTPAPKELPKWCRCRSRKRYIKLLRAMGCNRKIIEAWLKVYAITKKDIRSGYSYQDAWLSLTMNAITKRNR